MATTAFLVKDFIAQFFRQNKFRFSTHHFIIFAVAAYQHQYKLAKGHCHLLRIYWHRTKRRFKHSLVSGFFLKSYIGCGQPAGTTNCKGVGLLSIFIQAIPATKKIKINMMVIILMVQSKT